MELGATICTPQNPLCQSCPIRTLCHAYKEVQSHEDVIKKQTPFTLSSPSSTAATEQVKSETKEVKQEKEGEFFSLHSFFCYSCRVFVCNFFSLMLVLMHFLVVNLDDNNDSNNNNTNSKKTKGGKKQQQQTKQQQLDTPCTLCADWDEADTPTASVTKYPRKPQKTKQRDETVQVCVLFLLLLRIFFHSVCFSTEIILIVGLRVGTTSVREQGI